MLVDELTDYYSIWPFCIFLNKRVVPIFSPEKVENYRHLNSLKSRSIMIMPQRNYR